jgi:hypothetical protein
VEAVVLHRRRRTSACAGAVLLGLFSIFGATAASAIPVVSIEGGMGLAGGTVAAMIALAGEGSANVAAADLTISFDNPPLFAGTTSCQIAARLSASHSLTASIPMVGKLEVGIEPSDQPSPIDEGPMATCEFMIAPGAVAGTAALTLSQVMLFDTDGNPVPAESVNGDIVIGGPTPTPTPTPSATATGTRTGTATTIPTPTETPTATPSPTAFFLVDDFGNCSIVAAPTASAWPLLPIAALYWLRRRRR